MKKHHLNNKKHNNNLHSQPIELPQSHSKLNHKLLVGSIQIRNHLDSSISLVVNLNQLILQFPDPNLLIRAQKEMRRITVYNQRKNHMMWLMISIPEVRSPRHSASHTHQLRIKISKPLLTGKKRTVLLRWSLNGWSMILSRLIFIQRNIRTRCQKSRN